jgi:hypothetical protein
MTIDEWLTLKHGDMIVGPCGRARMVEYTGWKGTVAVRKIRKSWAIGSPNTYLHKEQARLYERWNSSEQSFIGDGI